ncbi:hypothetical protein L3Q82_004170 [Scortum barcoo]|uniref:Uncharacterized protein n=1 Tax=Scortum barcoo TaxID=214431 RepID=A0ACB8X776_9TELE|nr:hypothetical protein L3Q82_004170 [Scortum barcoo]
MIDDVLCTCGIYCTSVLSQGEGSLICGSSSAQDRLQFAYQPGVGVQDAILYLLHRAHSHLDKGSGTVRILFLDFSRAFNTIQPPLLRDKMSRMGVDPHMMDWISDYLTDRPQYIGLKDNTSDTVVSSTGAPQGTVLAPLLFTLDTSDFCYNSELCHIRSGDTAIIGCIRDDREEEYRRLVGALHGATLTTYSSTPLKRRSWLLTLGGPDQDRMTSPVRGS